MKIKLNWALFLLTAASYVLYPVWHLPLPAPARWALLNFFILLSAAVLYSPLENLAIDAALPELKELWPAILLVAAACLPFWLSPIPTGSDDQSHAGPAAWLIGRLASGAGFNIAYLPLVSLPAAALAAAGAVRLCRKGLALPGRGTAALTLAAAGNLYFFADLRFGAAAAIGKYETILRYPPLSKFLYTGAYLLLGVGEHSPRIVQFLFMLLTAVCILRLLRYMKADPPPRLTYLLIAFFPTFFNLSTTSELEAGTVFFFTAAIYHFIKAAAEADKDHFLKCAFWLAAGLFYKQLPLGLMAAIVPVLVFLMYKTPGNRKVWAYGFKTLLLPAAVGLPFIFLGSAYGIRDAGLKLSNLLDPALILMNIQTVYWTCGSLITALLAFSALKAAYGHRNLVTGLLVYFAVVYYAMITASIAAGYIRHAQPSYVAPVLLLALWASELKPGRRWFRPAYALMIPLFIFQAVFARDPYQRRTLPNFARYCFPYWQAADYLKSAGGSLRVYAPMEVEPSHFYLAKAGLAGRITWDRTLPPKGFSAPLAAKTYQDGAYDYMLLPDSPFSGVIYDFPAIVKDLEASGGFHEAKLFDYHGNKLILLRSSSQPDSRI